MVFAIIHFEEHLPGGYMPMDVKAVAFGNLLTVQLGSAPSVPTPHQHPATPTPAATSSHKYEVWVVSRRKKRLIYARHHAPWC